MPRFGLKLQQSSISQQIGVGSLLSKGRFARFTSISLPEKNSQTPCCRPSPKESPLRVIIEPTPAEVDRRAARFIADLVRRKPDCVLGLATGTTPLGTYRELIRLHREESLDFSHVTTFNLDEYVGLAPSHPHSYRYFMQKNLFEHLNFDPSRTHVPDGRALDFDAHCRQYEQRIRDAGGIDLQVLGIGSDGHIAFNEPGSSLGSRTRLKTLTGETVRDNARFFGSEEQVPRLAITMGVGTILESQRCLLLALGAGKGGRDSQHD